MGGGGGWEKRGIRLKVGFQPLKVISPTASWIWWCMQVYAYGDLVWTCLVWAKRYIPDSSWVLIHQLNSTAGELDILVTNGCRWLSEQIMLFTGAKQ